MQVQQGIWFKMRFCGNSHSLTKAPEQSLFSGPSLASGSFYGNLLLPIVHTEKLRSRRPVLTQGCPSSQGRAETPARPYLSTLLPPWVTHFLLSHQVDPDPGPTPHNDSSRFDCNSVSTAVSTHLVLPRSLAPPPQHPVGTVLTIIIKTAIP